MNLLIEISSLLPQLENGQNDTSVLLSNHAQTLCVDVVLFLL
jgi:hypothetical protein